MDVTRTFVLDGSVTLVWGFSDENDDYATAILDRMAELQAYVPNLWPLEVANALLVGERRGRTTPADAAHFLAILGAFPIAVDVVIPPLNQIPGGVLLLRETVRGSLTRQIVRTSPQ